jgi:hypothetical protein
MEPNAELSTPVAPPRRELRSWEFAAAGAAGFKEAALGKNILRTETAVCAVLAAVQYVFGASPPATARDYSVWSTPSRNTPVGRIQKGKA